MPVSYGSKQHIPPTNYHLLAAQQLLFKNVWKFSGRSQEKGPLAEKMTRLKEQKD